MDGRGLRKYDHAAMTSYVDVQTAGAAAGMSARLDDRLHRALQLLFGLGLVRIVKTCSNTAFRPKPKQIVRGRLQLCRCLMRLECRRSIGCLYLLRCKSLAQTQGMQLLMQLRGNFIEGRLIFFMMISS